MKVYEKAFYALFISSLLSAICAVGKQTYFPLFLRELELDYSMIGIISAATGIGGAIFQLLFGAIIDKKENLNKKKIFVSSLLVRSLFYLTFFLSTNLGLFFLANFIIGVFGAINRIIGNTIVTDITSKEKIGGRIGLFRSSTSIGFAMGGVIFGLIANYFKLKQMFLLFTLIGLLGFLIISGTPFKHSDKKKSKQNSISNVNDSSVIKIKSLSLIFFFIALILIGLADRSDTAYRSIFLLENGISSTNIGFMIGLGAFLEAPMLILIGKLCDFIDEKKIMIIGAFSFTILYFVYSQAYSFPVLFIIQISKGLIYGLFTASCLAFIGKFPSKERGKAFGFYYLSITMTVGIIGPILAGFFSDLYGLRNLYLLASIFSLFSVFILIFNILRFKALKKS